MLELRKDNEDNNKFEIFNGKQSLIIHHGRNLDLYWNYKDDKEESVPQKN